MNYRCVNFDEGDKYIKESLYQKKKKKIMLAEFKSTCGRVKVDPYVSPCMNINSKCTKDLNVRKTFCQLFASGNISKTVQDTGIENIKARNSQK